MAFRKPNFMRHTDYIDECCQALAKAREYSTDEQLIHYSRMLSLTEQVGNVFGYGIAGEAVKLSAERVQLTVKSFLAQLEGLRRNFPSNFTEYRSWSSSYLSEIFR